MPSPAANPLGLRLPELLKTPAGAAEVRPREIDIWIRQLPVASTMETASRLFKAIQDLNRTRIPPQNRLPVVDLLAPPIRVTTETLQQKFFDMPFPLSEKLQRSAYICIRLNEELAFGYKLAVTDLVKTKLGFQDRKLLVTALFRAMQCLRDVIYKTALLYAPYPRYIWQEVHNLFAFADTNQWSATKIKVKSDGETEHATIRDMYHQLLLFGAASPFRLRQREMRTLYQSLPRWSGHIRLAPWSDSQDGETRFAVLLKQDLPPINISLVTKPVEQPALEMDTGELVQVLRETFDDMPSDADTVQPELRLDELPKSTLRRLIQALRSSPKRQFARTRLNFELDIAVGLSSIHRLISGEPGRGREGSVTAQDGRRSLNSNLNAESAFSTELMTNDSGLALMPIDESDHVYMRGYQSFGPASTTEPEPSQPSWIKPDPFGPGEQHSQQKDPPAQPELLDSLTLRTINESAGGYCVEWIGDKLPGVKVGELIGIQLPVGEQGCSLAVARWMRTVPNGGLNLGLQLIAPNTLPVTATLAARSQRTPTRCLLVQELKSADRPASLITPIVAFQVGTSLRIRYRDDEHRVKLVRLLEATGAFVQFQLEYE